MKPECRNPDAERNPKSDAYIRLAVAVEKIFRREAATIEKFLQSSPQLDFKMFSFGF